jgi:acetyl-CoA C-acetyltransferase
MDHDGLWDAFEHIAMGASTEQHNAGHAVSREDQDAWAAESHRRLEAGADFLEAEIAPYTIRGRKGDTVLSVDDGLRKGTTVDSLSSLAPAFGAGGGITAGNASQITDGAAAVVLADESVAADLGLSPIARILGSAMVAGPDVSLHSQPSNAIRAALRTLGRSTDDLAAVEINEAFAAVAVVSTRELGVDPAIVNAYGGAIALGHPIGASGARIVGHVARRLAALGSGSFGAAGICGGGGQGSAVLLEAI